MNIYVGNLSFDMTDEQLRNTFEQYGAVENAQIIIDRFTSRSRGFGFVEMADQEQAIAAINALNGTEVFGRSLRVNEAKPREDQGPRVRKRRPPRQYNEEIQE